MKKNYLFFPILIISLIIISSCAGNSKQLIPPAEITIMKYQSTPDLKLTYKVNDTFTQTMKFQGQKSETTVQKDMIVSMISSIPDDGDLNFDVQIDEISMKVSSKPGGDITPDLKQIPGIPFQIKIDPLGEDLEITGADALKYTLGQSGDRTLQRDFEHFFPNLPGYALNIGDTWTTTDTLDLSEDVMKLDMVILSNNKLSGYERVGDHECARIEVEYTSTVFSSGNQQGTNFTTLVEISGSETWYFDYIQGIYVKLISSGSGDGTLTVSGPQTMSIPVTHSVDIDVSLVE